MNLIPAETKAPISKTSTERLKLPFQHHRTEKKKFKEKNDEFQIKKPSMELNAEFGDDMVTIMSGANQLKISPFMKFF